jgi:hypothetical protein
MLVRSVDVSDEAMAVLKDTVIGYAEKGMKVKPDAAALFGLIVGLTAAQLAD